MLISKSKYNLVEEELEKLKKEFKEMVNINNKNEEKILKYKQMDEIKLKTIVDLDKKVKSLTKQLSEFISIKKENLSEVSTLEVVEERITSESIKISDINIIYKLADIEEITIAYVLQKTQYNKMETANLLGIGRTTLYEKIRKFHLDDHLNVENLNRKTELLIEEAQRMLRSWNYKLIDLEKITIASALGKTRWNKVETAKLLGIGRTTLYEKIRKYHLDDNEIKIPVLDLYEKVNTPPIYKEEKTFERTEAKIFNETKNEEIPDILKDILF